MAHTRNHQTLVAIYQGNGSKAYRSRVQRLRESLNGNQIKTDYVTVMTDGRIFSGLPFDVDPNNNIPETHTSVADLASALGYVMVLQVTPDAQPTGPAVEGAAVAAPSTVF